MSAPSLRSGLLVIVLMTLATFARADDRAWVDLEQRLSAEQRAATGLDTLTPEQLALLNRLLREQATALVEAARSEAKAEARAEGQAAGTQRDPDPSRFIGLADEPITARVQGEITGWKEGDEFRLDNGQVWKVLKGHFRLREAMVSPQVVVMPGVAGRWFLQVHEDLPKARVYRID
ncbi:hypothetical protein [Arenimonas terrae]|uniref:hypothetical protein n=1 Tax=Arenimonas terrae TaxID=2546226 RepID=UPI00159ED3B2|nr:hypothetical protein [Arenimonas terrae]